MGLAVFYVHCAAQRNQKYQEKRAKDEYNDGLTFRPTFGARQAMLVRQVKPVFADSANDTREAHIAPAFFRISCSIYQAGDSPYACCLVRALVVSILSVARRPPSLFCVYVFPRNVCACQRVSDAAEPSWRIQREKTTYLAQYIPRRSDADNPYT